MKIVLMVAILFCSVYSSFAEDAIIRPPLKQAGTSNQLVDSSQQIADLIVKSKIPVFIDFWAVWCGPCKLLNPIVKELEESYNGKVLFLKVNVDIHKGLANYFRVNAIPAVFIIKDKEVVKMLPGLQPKEIYISNLDKVLSSQGTDTTKTTAQKTDTTKATVKAQQK